MVRLKSIWCMAWAIKTLSDSAGRCSAAEPPACGGGHVNTRGIAFGIWIFALLLSGIAASPCAMITSVLGQLEQASTQEAAEHGEAKTKKQVAAPVLAVQQQDVCNRLSSLAGT